MFDPYSFLRSGHVDTVEVRPVAPTAQARTLATLAALAASAGKADKRRNQGQRVSVKSAASTAKAAKTANVGETADRGDGGTARVTHPAGDDTDPRAWAAGVARLDPENPPLDVPPARWRHIVDDSGRFLDGPFCAEAVALGWGSFDLFGCDITRPYARIDQMGLLWLLNGHRLLVLTEMSAVIEMSNGARQTFHRKTSEAGRVLAWELDEWARLYPKGI